MLIDHLGVEDQQTKAKKQKDLENLRIKELCHNILRGCLFTCTLHNNAEQSNKQLASIWKSAMINIRPITRRRKIMVKIEGWDITGGGTGCIKAEGFGGGSEPGDGGTATIGDGGTAI